MKTRIAFLFLIALSVASVAAAQDGQGASARPDATPPTRPLGLTPPPPVPANGGSRIQNLLFVYPRLLPPTTMPDRQDRQDEFGKGAHKAGEPGLVQPVVKSAPLPKYTAKGLKAKIQGTVTIEAVIQADGTVGDTRIVQSLDKTYGLDEAALAAVKEWTFEPGTLDRKPVPVLVTVTTEFRLH